MCWNEKLAVWFLLDACRQMIGEQERWATCMARVKQDMCEGKAKVRSICHQRSVERQGEDSGGKHA
jgi:hypothetical protein